MKSKLLIVIILIIVNIIFFNMSKVQASNSISDMIKGGDDFLKAGLNQDTKIDKDKLHDTSTTIYNILLFSGIVIAVVITGILGIQYMIASVEEKAKISEALVPFIVGCIVVFGAFGIWRIFIVIGNRFVYSG